MVMKMIKRVILLSLVLASLTSCALSPEEQRAREAAKIKQQQALQVFLARQCDQETADLMKQKFDPDVSLTAKQQQAFDEKYLKKMNDPLFQACYKLALQNYMAEKQLRQMEIERQFYYDYPPYDLGRPFLRHRYWRYW